MMRHWIALVALASGACHASPGARTQHELQVFEREQSSERLLTRGRAFAKMGDTVRAQQYLEAALEAGADDSEVTPELVKVCVRDGRYRLATGYAERYLQRHPGDQRVGFVLGTLYAGLGDSEAAESTLERVARADSDNAEARYALAVVLRDQRGDMSRASKYFSEYLRLEPHGEHAEEARGFGQERAR